MFTRTSLALAAAAALFAASAHAQTSPRFTLELLPTLGGPSALALALNDAGQVVGHSADATVGNRAFFWQREVGMLPVPGPVLESSRALAINELGVVAVSRYGSGPLVAQWTRGVGVINLRMPIALNRGAVYGLNDVNEAVGSAGSDTVISLAMRWGAGGGVQQIGATGSFSTALAINRSGQAVGSSGLDSSSALPTLWSASNEKSTLVGPFLALWGRAEAINNHGVVAGWYTTGGSDFVAFTWSATQGLQSLRSPGSSWLRGVNDSGLAVDEHIVDDTYVSAMAVRPGGGMLDLGALTGVDLESANDTNNHAQIVANGNGRAHLLTLHPDWTGGDGSWNQGSGTQWSFAGLAGAGVVGRMHEVVINPGQSATVRGAALGQALSLRVGGTARQVVVLDLNGGTTSVATRTTLDTGGVLRGQGRHQGDVSVGGQGRIEVGAGQTMQVAGNLSQLGLVDVRAASGQATLEVTGSWSSRGQINLLNGVLRAQGGLTNQSTLNIAGAIQVLGDVDNRASGRILVSGVDSEVVFWDTLANHGSVNVTAGSTATFFGAVTGAGSFAGAGTKHFAGGYSPGASPGLVTLEGTVVFDGGTLLMELAGGAAGGQHDKLVFNTASVALGSGTVLSVVLQDGFSPSLGDQFDLFDWNGGLGGGSGSFGELRLPTLAAGLVWDTGRLYLEGSLGVTAVPEPQSWALLALGLVSLVVRRRQ